MLCLQIMKQNKLPFILIVIGVCTGVIFFTLNHFFPVHALPAELCAVTSHSRRGSCRTAFLLLLPIATIAVLYILSFAAIRSFLPLARPFTISFFAAGMVWAFAFYSTMTTLSSAIDFTVFVVSSICAVSFAYWYIAVLTQPLLYRILAIPFIVGLISYMSQVIFTT